MKKLNKNQWIAVFAGLAFLSYLLFPSIVTDLLNFSSNDASSEETPEAGVETNDVVVGEGPVAELGDTLTVHYVGALTDGRVFDSSIDRNTPFSFTLGAGQVIRGWEEGLVGMRVGGTRVLVITPEYGYGEQSVGSIPANSTLIFEVELLEVEKPQPTSDQ